MLEKSYFENQRDVLLNNFSEFLLESTLVKSLSFVNHLSFRRKLPYHFKKEDLKIFETVLSEKYEKFVVEDSEFQVLLEDPSIERLADLLEYLCCSSCNSPLKRGKRFYCNRVCCGKVLQRAFPIREFEFYKRRVDSRSTVRKSKMSS